jgi:membrane protein
VRLADQVEAGFDRAIAAARKQSGLFDHVWQAGQRFTDVLAGRLAAAISYYAFFAAFSLAVLGYSILGRLLGTADSGVLTAINGYLEDSLPWVANTAREVGRSEVTALAAIGLLVAGVGWVEALRSSLRAVWLYDQHPGHWFLRRVVDLGMLVGLGLLLGLSLAMTGALARLIDWLAPDTNLGQDLVRRFGPVLEFVVNVVLAAAMLTAVPRLRLSPRRLLWPVLVVAVGIQVLNTVGRLFIARSEGRPAYQLVAGAVGLLIYLYLLNQLILFGAALTATSTAGTVVDLAGGATPALPDPAARAPSGRPDRTTSAGIGADGPVDMIGERRGHQPRDPR